MKRTIAALFAANTVLLMGCYAQTPKAQGGEGLVVETRQSDQDIFDLIGFSMAAYEAKPEAYINDILKISPDRKHFAIFDGGATRIYGAEKGQWLYISGARPITWDGNSSKLYVVDKRGIFYSLSVDGKTAQEPWLTKLFGQKALAENFNSSGLIAGHFGLIAMPDPSRRTVTVANLAQHTHFSVITGAKWLSSRPASRLEIGWNAVKGMPAVFISEQELVGQTSNRAEVANRLEVYGPNGEKEYFGVTGGTEVQFLPVLTDGGARLLTRSKNFRCLHSLAQTGELRQEGACDTDIQAATVDNNGDVLTYSPFVTRRSIVGPDYAAAVGDYDSLLPVEVDGSGVAVFWKDDRSGSAFLEVSEKDGAHPRVLAKGRSPKHQGFNAIPVSGKTADNFVAHGFLLSPAANAKLAGLVVVLHGGPYTASDDSLTTPLSDELLDRGYAVLSVNYRGTPGYGRSYLEKGFDGGAARMLDDVDAVQSSALKILGRGRDLPVFLYGRSFGGLLAIKAMRERANVYTGYLIEGGICDFNVSAQNVMLPESATKASLRDVLEPSIGAYNLRIATDANGHALELNDCDVTLPDTARLVVLHSKDDPIAPYASMANFANRQSVDRTTLVTFQNEGHAPLTTLRTGSRDQFNLVAGKVIDFLGGGRLSIIPRPTTDEPQHESR